MLKSLTITFLIIGGCSSTAPTPDTPPPISTDPIVVVKPVAASSCADKATCAAECTSGNVASCTLAADYTFQDDPKAARTVYQAGCDKHDSEACARLLEHAGGDLNAATNAAKLACGVGNKRACAFLSELTALAFAAPRPGEEPSALLRLSEQSSMRGCDRGSYTSCFNAVSLLRFRKATSEEISEAATKGLVYAEAACAERQYGACRLVAGWAEKANDKEGAAVANLGVCSIERRMVARDADISAIPSCKRAAELGAGLDDIRAKTEPAPLAPTSERLVPQKAIEAKRISGGTQVQPNEKEHAAIRQSKKPAVAALKLCLSARGGVSSLTFLQPSPYPAWNRMLFETVRGWRYWPFTVDDKPVPVCTSVTFVFKAG